MRDMEKLYKEVDKMHKREQENKHRNDYKPNKETSTRYR